jgi:peroxiredoxin
MNPNESTTTDPTVTPARTPVGALLFCGALMLVGGIFLAIVAWRYLHPADTDAPPPRDIAAEAQKLIRESKPAPLSAPLAEILAKAENVHFDSYKHPLVGKPAPDFTRPDVFGNRWALKDELVKGPVVLVVYLGYHCNHCVSQLFDANEDYKYFQELRAEIVAVSPDSAHQTKDKYKKYQPFAFPVLSDRDNSIAEAYGVYNPAKDGKPEDLQHGTFIVDQAGIVRWAAFGPAPFGHNETLLYELAKITGRVK